MIQPGESLFCFLDRINHGPAHEARQRWNNAVSLIPEGLRREYLPRLLDKRHYNALAAFFELQLCVELQGSGLDAQLVQSEGSPDVEIALSNGRHLIEAKLRMPQAHLAERHDMLTAVCQSAARHVKARHVRLRVTEVPDTQTPTPSGKRLARWIDNNADRIGEDLVYRDAGGWQMGVQLFECSSSRQPLESVFGGSIGDTLWDRSEELLSDDLKSKLDQHSTKRGYVSPAIAWNDFEHEPEHVEREQACLKLALEHGKPVHMIWAGPCYPWRVEPLELSLYSTDPATCQLWEAWSRARFEVKA